MAQNENNMLSVRNPERETLRWSNPGPAGRSYKARQKSFVPSKVKTASRVCRNICAQKIVKFLQIVALVLNCDAGRLANA